MADLATWLKWLGAGTVGVGLLALGRSALARPASSSEGAGTGAGPALPLPSLPPFKPSMTYLDGIDVSKWQGFPGGSGLAAPPDWSKVHDAGVQFVISKAVHGIWADKSFATNWPATSIFAARGAYCYGRFADSPTKQADALIAACETFGGLRDSGDLLAVDLEWMENEAFVADPKTGRKANTSHCAAWIRSFVAQVVKATGRPPLIYTGPGFWDAMGNPNIPELGSYPLWTAQYTLASKPTPFGPWKSKGDGFWTFWQYQGDAGNDPKHPLPARYDRRVPGIASLAVDRNFFHGSLAELRALTEARV